MSFKKNTAVTGFTFGLISATDGSAITTGTPAGYNTLDGGSQGSIAGTPVHEGNGQWSVDLTAGEMNGGLVGLLFTHASAIPVSFTIKTDTKIVSELQDPTAAACQADVSNLDAAVSSRSSHNAAAVWAVVTRALTDKAGFGLADNAITAAKIATDAIDADALKADAANQIRDAIFAHNPTAGAGTFADIAIAIYAMARGKISKSGAAFTFYDDDDTTALFTLTIAASARTTA